MTDPTEVKRVAELPTQLVYSVVHVGDMQRIAREWLQMREAILAISTCGRKAESGDEMEEALARIDDICANALELEANGNGRQECH